MCKGTVADKGVFHPVFISLKDFLGLVAEVLTLPGTKAV